MKSVHDTKVGDTVTHAAPNAQKGPHHQGPSTDPLPGFKDVKPMVFAGVFPTDSADYSTLRDALEKLHLNDAAFSFEPDTSEALGFGFRCGFLGLLHMEIIQERLEREFDLDLITTAPSVVYEVHKTDGTMMRVENPSKLPSTQWIERIDEPIVKMTIHVPSDYVGPVLALCQERRGIQKAMQYASADRVIITYDLPFGEVLFDFHDKLKSIVARVRLDGLRGHRVPAGGSGQGRHPRERRPARRALDHRPPGQGATCAGARSPRS